MNNYANFEDKVNNISISQWCVYHQQTPIIQNLSLQAQSGDMLALYGPSGCGKTTLLHSLGLLHLPQLGHITINQNAFTFNAKVKPKAKPLQHLQKHLGLVLQNYGLWPHMTVLENISAAPIFVEKKSKDTAIQLAKYWIEALGLQGLENHMPQALSGGQQQRVALARCLILEPEIILLDEPTAALDQHNASQLGHILQKFAKDGKIIIFSSHDQSFIQNYATSMLNVGSLT